VLRVLQANPEGSGQVHPHGAPYSASVWACSNTARATSGFCREQPLLQAHPVCLTHPLIVVVRKEVAYQFSPGLVDDSLRGAAMPSL